ncbi:MAG TPA: hypothetical protein VK272_01235 [Solirubrobacteraceae bacterium]|nr:hypothetical protein [Solirubrobacteraceae bacterium]
MASTATPETERLTDELIKRLGEGPLTPRQLATELATQEAPATLIGAFDAALSRSAAANETDQLDETLWGSTPTDQELALARRTGYSTLASAMHDALSDALTRDQAAERLGITPQAVSKRVASGGLVALRRGRINRVPAWQFYEDTVLPGLKQVISTYPGGALSLTVWATSPSPDLDGATPAQALARRDGLARVIEAARALTPAAW